MALKNLLPDDQRPIMQSAMGLDDVFGRQVLARVSSAGVVSVEIASAERPSVVQRSAPSVERAEKRAAPPASTAAATGKFAQLVRVCAPRNTAPAALMRATCGRPAKRLGRFRATRKSCAN